MIKESIMNAVLIAAMGGGFGAGKFYADHNVYESKLTAEESHEALIQMINIAAVSAAQVEASNKQRILQLQGWIAEAHGVMPKPGR